MLLYNRKESISVGFKKYKYENIDYHNDIALDVLEHFSYTMDLEELEIGFLKEGQHITECDYCGKQIFRNWLSRMDNGKGGKISQEYINPNDEYPCTDDCCPSCVGKKNRVVWFEEYGVVKNIKAIETMERNGKIPTSRQQIYLSNLLNAKLNQYFKEIGFVDLVLENGIVIEYDGSGHYVGINYGKYTYDEKIQQDYNRDLKLRELGYKIIRIHSEYDYLPSDDIIISEINNILNYFDKTGKEFFKWVIPKSKKDRRYGTLRTIGEEDL